MSFKNRNNVYTCERCGGRIVTVDRDDGVTPYLIGCEVKKGCNGRMKSSFYRTSGAEIPTHEWRKATPAEYAAASRAMRDHFDKGGLDLHPISKAPGYIYLASPYSHPDPAVVQARFDAAVKCAGELMLKGLVVFSPIAHSHPIALATKLPETWEFWRSIDFPLLERAHSLFVMKLDGWERSTGVQAEIARAGELGIPIVFIDVDDDMQVAA